MSDGADFISDLQNLPDDVVSANTGSLETHRGSDDVTQGARPDQAAPVQDGGEGDKPAKPVSLRDQISSALKAEATPPTAQLNGEAARNPDGTFAAKPDASADPNAPAVAAPVSAVQYPQAGIPGLTAETFASLPAETQQHVARTMDTLNQQAAQYASYAQIEQVISPRRQAWAMNGMTEGAVLNQLFALSDFAEQRPEEFIRYFANQRGLDLEDIAFGVDPVDPTVAAQNQRIQQLEAQLNGVTTHQQQIAHQNTVDEIVAFADEKGADGTTLLRPYFAELGTAVLPFIEQAIKQNPNRPRAEILTEAYDAACWANPKVREKMLAAQAAAAEAKRIKDQSEAAARARTAGVSVPSGSPGDGATRQPGTSSGSLRDDIRASIAAST